MSFNVWLGGDVVDFGGVVAGDRGRAGRHRRAAGGRGEHAADRRGARLAVLERPAPRRLALPADRPAGGARRSTSRAGAAGAGLRARERPPHLGPLRPVPRARRARRSRRCCATSAPRACRRSGPRSAAVGPALRRGIPTLMTGDFNTPSYLDWTPAADAARDGHPLPRRLARHARLAAAGFTDAYRVVHPDPVANPGITWTFGYPFPRLRGQRGRRPDRPRPGVAGVQVLDAGSPGRPARPT